MALPSRRRVLRAATGAGAAAIGSALVGCSGSDPEARSATSVGPVGPGPSITTPGPATASTVPGPVLPTDPFTLGVASGDPTPDAVVLWTRLAPDPLAGGGMPAEDVPVVWELSPGADFAELVAAGSVVAVGEHAHSVHVDATGLRPDSWYHYRFRVGDWVSPVGRTRTSPAAGAVPERFRFAHASCQAFDAGYYAAHAAMAGDDLDLVVFLGDYIYERPSQKGSPRSHAGGEAVTLVEYRNRYAQYKADPHLQAAHAACPWVLTWDDHEVDGNYAGASPRDGATVEAAAFLERRAAAYRAWWEHQPVRMAPPVGSDLRIHRELAWGDLAEVFVLDGRQYRSDQACGDVTLSLDAPCSQWDDPDRTMLGAQQQEWLVSGLADSPARWKILANQTVMTDFTLGPAVLNHDQWDGYPAARAELLDAVASAEVQDVVVLTGDIHIAAVGRVGDPTAPVATELVCTSVSSLPPQGLPTDLVQAVVPGVDHFDPVHRGYTRNEVTPRTWTAEYVVVDALDPSAAEAGGAADVDARFEIRSGAVGARRL